MSRFGRQTACREARPARSRATTRLGRKRAAQDPALGERRALKKRKPAILAQRLDLGETCLCDIPAWEKTPRLSSRNRPFWHTVPAWEKSAGTRSCFGKTSESPKPITWTNAETLLHSRRSFSPKPRRCAKQGRTCFSNTWVSPKARQKTGSSQPHSQENAVSSSPQALNRQAFRRCSTKAIRTTTCDHTKALIRPVIPIELFSRQPLRKAHRATHGTQ